MEVLHEGYLEKCVNPLENRKDFRKRYFVLKRALGGGIMTLEYYKDKDWKRLEPKGVLTLFSSFTVEKLVEQKRKFPFQVISVENMFLLAALSSEGRTKWCEILEENMTVRSFEVTPEDVQSLHSLGSYNWNHCFLQISSSDLHLKCGTKEVVAWPFSCIRRYKCRNGVFVVEVGRKAPSGEGVFSFRTHKHQQVFEHLDRAVKDRFKHKDSFTEEFGEIGQSQVHPGLSNGSHDFKRGRSPLEGKMSDNDVKSGSVEEYNHLDFAQAIPRSSGSHSKVRNALSDDTYNHLASTRSVPVSPIHRASDFGLPSPPNLVSCQKLSKSMGSLNSGDVDSGEYSSLDTVDSVSPRDDAHMNQLKRILESQGKAHNSYNIPRAGLSTSPNSGAESQYDVLHGTKPHAQVVNNFREVPNRNAFPSSGPEGPNEYDCLSTGRTPIASAPLRVTEQRVQDDYDHLQSNDLRIASQSNSSSQGVGSPPAPAVINEYQAPKGIPSQGSGKSIPSEENETPQTKDNVAAKGARKPELRPKPSGAGHALANLFGSKSAQKPIPKAREGAAAPKSSGAPLSPKSSNKASNAPLISSGIGQAIAQAGLVAQLKKSLAAGAFNASKNVECTEPSEVKKPPVNSPQKPPRPAPSKKEIIYAVSPFGKDVVEAAENEYMNIGELQKPSNNNEYDTVGSVLEGEVYEAMSGGNEYNRVGETVSCGSGESIYDVPRGEGIC